MTIEDILALEDKKKAFDILTRDTNQERDRLACRDEYKGDRMRRDDSVDYREGKEVDVFSETETVTDSNGEETPKKLGAKSIPVAKVKTNIPKRIVRIAAAFLFGGKMNVNFSDENEAASFFKDKITNL